MKFNNSLEVIKFKEFNQIKNNLVKIATYSMGTLTMAHLLDEYIITVALGLNIAYIKDSINRLRSYRTTKTKLKSEQYNKYINL